MYFLGRAMQFAGMVVLPLAMLMELQGQATTWQMLTMTAFGATLFALGYVISGLGRPT